MSRGNKDKASFKEKYKVYIAAGITAWIIFMFVHPVSIAGNAMEPTLSAGQIVIVSKDSFKREPPEISSIVSFHRDFEESDKKGSNRVRRVVGISGDTIEIRGGTLYRNGEVVSEPYLMGKMDEDYKQVTLQTGEIYVLGDNRDESIDSRQLGPMKITDLKGTCNRVIWPLSQWKGI